MKSFKNLLSIILSVSVIICTLTLGANAQSAGDFTYDIYPDEGVVIITGYKGSDKNVVIPDTIDGVPVTEIGSQAFYYNWDITGVVLPDTVKRISDGAFWGCENLSAFKFSASLESIGTRAFWDTALKEVIMPDSLKELDERTFGQCRFLTKVKIGSSLTAIPESAFYDCAVLNSIEIPDNITSIGREAFALCYELSSVKIGKGVRVIETNAFHDCPCTGVVIPVNVTQIDKEAFGFYTDKSSSSFDTGIIEDFYIVGASESTAQEYAQNPQKADIVDSNTVKLEFRSCTHSVGTEEVVGKVPTCTEVGTGKLLCKDCAYVVSEYDIESLGHDFVFDSVVAPNCTAQGYDVYKCTRCGETEHRNFTEPTGDAHRFSTPVVVEPTCTEQGYTVEVCEICGYEYKYDYVMSRGHDIIPIPLRVVEPTCTEEGYSVYICSRCDKTFNLEYKPALGHDWKAVTPYIEPTCTEGSEQDFVCDRCGEKMTQSYSALGHSYEVSQVVAPTCTEGGYSVYACVRCDDSYLADTVNPLGHSFKQKIVEPTYKTLGYSYVYCARNCGYKKDDPNYAKPVKKLVVKAGALKATPVSTSSIKLVWTKTVGAEKYEVYNAATKKTVKTVTGTSYTVKGLKAGTRYKFAVRAVAGTNKSSYCTVIMATKPKATSVSSAKARSGRKALIKWKKVSACDGYQIQYSTSKSFKKFVKTVKISKKTTVSKTIKNLKKGKKYYVRVRTFKIGYGNTAYGSWSKVKSFKAK